MSVHAYHDALPGYSDGQILHDGCEECEKRAKSRGLGIAELDRHNFVRAWERAAQWNRSGLPDISAVERPMLDVLWAVQIKLEQRGVGIGEVPSGF